MVCVYLPFIHGHAHMYRERERDRQTDGRTDGQAHTHPDTHTHTHTNGFTCVVHNGRMCIAINQAQDRSIPATVA